jgi:hypothetical protein
MKSRELGPVYTKGDSFRARAEARQREHRVQLHPEAGFDRWGHRLDQAAAEAGVNFVIPEAFEEAKKRFAQGKGVCWPRTSGNMLSSQAMCFNLFTPLKRDHRLALGVLRRFLPTLASVGPLEFEHTPEKDIFNDQTGQGGVDCDVMVEGLDHDGVRIVLTIETKFVEEEFSPCGFRKPGRKAHGKPVCPDDIALDGDFERCLYTSRKGYLYWQRSKESGNLRLEALPRMGCAFAGPAWQLWVNHTLASMEAAPARRGPASAFFAVCAPSKNKELLDDGRVLQQFKELLSNPESLVFIDIDDLIAAIRDESEGTEWSDRWWRPLAARYAGI